MADENLIGRGRCPVCANTKARFTFSKKMLCCMTCNACNAQLFARSDSSDEKMRAMVQVIGTEASEAPKPAANDAAKTPEKPTNKPAPGWGWESLNHG